MCDLLDTVVEYEYVLVIYNDNFFKNRRKQEKTTEMENLYTAVWNIRWHVTAELAFYKPNFRVGVLGF